MKAWKKAAILSLVVAGILVPTSIMLLRQKDVPGVNSPAAVPENAYAVLENNARNVMSRSVIVRDHALDLTKVEYLGTWGLREDGWYVDPGDPSAVIVVDEYRVSFSSFQDGTVLESYNAVIDEILGCVIYLHIGRYVAYIVRCS